MPTEQGVLRGQAAMQGVTVTLSRLVADAIVECSPVSWKVFCRNTRPRHCGSPSVVYRRLAVLNGDAVIDPGVLEGLEPAGW